MTNKPIFEVWNEEYTEKVELPAKFVVCDRCDGRGVHDHDAFGNGLRQEELEDYDFMEDYMRGVHDVRCSECKGERVVAVPDEERLNDAQKALLQAHWDAENERRAERAMRSRGIEF